MSLQGLTKAQLLGATPPEERVEIAALRGSVLIVGLMATERDDFEASRFEGEGKARVFSRTNLRAALVARCVRDDTGARMFTDGEAADLGKTRADVIDRLYAVAARLSGISKADEDELGKGSGSDQPGASSSTSPAS